MELAKLREKLLAQHSELRRLAQSALAAASEGDLDHGSLGHLRELIDNLVDRLAEHNHLEETELHPVLPTIDAWGKVRDAAVDERHHSEHQALLSALGVVRIGGEPSAIAATIKGALAELLKHMDFEEQEFLNATVLRDDIVSGGVSS